MEMNEWIETREVSTKELDEKVKAYQAARKEYEDAKAISDDRHARAEAEKYELIKLLEVAGKQKYEAEGVGKITLVKKLKVTTPKDLPSKMEFYNWLHGKFGDDYFAYLSINYQTLNSLYNQELEQASLNGTEFNIPGLDKPTAETELRFSKTK